MKCETCKRKCEFAIDGGECEGIMQYFIGIDPGTSGGIGIVDSNGLVVNTFKFKDATFADISEMFEYVSQLDGQVFAMLEQVHAMPKQGVSSTFKFGQSYGFLEGMLVAHKIAYEHVTPQKWQKAIGCLSKGNKNVTKQMAQQLWPSWKFTHANADATLIAEYFRRVKK